MYRYPLGRCSQVDILSIVTKSNPGGLFDSASSSMASAVHEVTVLCKSIFDALYLTYISSGYRAATTGLRGDKRGWTFINKCSMN